MNRTLGPQPRGPVVLVDQYDQIAGGQRVLLDLAQIVSDAQYSTISVGQDGPLSEEMHRRKIRCVPIAKPTSPIGLLRTTTLLLALNPAPILVILNGPRLLPLLVLCRVAQAFRSCRPQLVLYLHSRPAHRWQRFIYRNASRLAHRRIAVAHVLADTIAAPFMVVHNRPTRDASTVALDDQSVDSLPKIKALGRLDHVKGLDLLVGALKRLSTDQLSWSAHIATAPPLAGCPVSLEQLMKTAPPQVIFEEGRSAMWFQPGDIVCVPSRAEASPLVILDAMAASCLVVASRIGGIPELITHGATGILFEPNSVESLTNALRHVLKMSASERRVLRRQSQDFAWRRLTAWPNEIKFALGLR
jgi:glycosyltransferase involved in cell wall biosynthesis